MEEKPYAKQKSGKIGQAGAAVRNVTGADVCCALPAHTLAALLEYDMADVPILIGAFMFGPLEGLLLTAVVSLLQALTVSAGSGWVGCAMHFFATGAFAVVAGIIYRRRHNMRGAIEGLLVGSATMIAVMVPLNYFLTPIFVSGQNMTYADAQGYIWSVMWSFVAFNSAKAAINSVVTFVVYKPLSRLFHKEFGRK